MTQPSHHQRGDGDPATVGQMRDMGRRILNRDELAAVMAEAVKEGIRAAVSDPAMWAAAGAAMQKHAVESTGELVLGGLKVGLRRLFLGGLILGGIYMAGGWSALAAAWKFVTGAHP